MAGWTWADHPEHEDESGVKWGDFALTGTFDGTTFTVTDAIPAALYDALNEEPEPLPGTPCEPPAGGWAVVDAAKATPEAMDATFTEAARLPGFAGTWMDQSQDPSANQRPHQGDHQRRRHRGRRGCRGDACARPGAGRCA